MKIIKYVAKIYLFINIIILLISCNMENKGRFIAKPIIEKVDGINVIVDPNVEMMMILGRLAGNRGFENEFSSQNYYLDKVDEYFGKFELSNEINLIKESDLYYDLIPEFAMYLNKDDTDFVMKLNDKKFILRDGPANEQEFYCNKENLNIIRNFRKKTAFDNFFDENRNIYEKMIADNISFLKEIHLASWLETFYGYGTKNNPCLYLTYIAGNYGIQYRNRKGDVIPHSVVLGDADRVGFIFLCSHEFSHSKTKMLVEKLFENPGVKDVFQKQFNKDPEFYSQSGYGDAIWVLNETFNQACANKFLEKNLSEYEMTFINQFMVENQKMIYVPEIASFLDNYETNRKKYKTLESFLPELEKYIANLK